MRGIKAASTGAHVDGEYTSGKNRAHHGAGHDVLLRLEERFHHAVHRSASRQTARDLRNHQLRKLQLGMMPAIVDQRSRQLFGGGDANIGNYAAMQGLGIIKIYDVFYEVRAIAGNAAVVRTIRRRVVSADQSRVLLRAGFNFEAVARAVVGRAYKLVPVPIGGSAVRFVRSDPAQMQPSVAITEKCDHLGVGEQRDVLGPLDGIEVRDQGNRRPVVAVDAVIAAEHNPRLPVRAGAQHQRRVGANT